MCRIAPGSPWYGTDGSTRTFCTFPCLDFFTNARWCSMMAVVRAGAPTPMQMHPPAPLFDRRRPPSNPLHRPVPRLLHRSCTLCSYTLGWTGHRRRLELTSKFTVGRTPWRAARFCSVVFRVPFVRFHARTWHEVPLHVVLSWRDAKASAGPRRRRTEDGRSLRSTIGIGTGWERRTRLEGQPVHRSGEGGTCLIRSRCLYRIRSIKLSTRKATWEK